MLKRILLRIVDMFHPVLIKELRQEMRTRGFVQGLLIFHAAIGIFVANELVSYSGGPPGRDATGWFWTIIGIGFLVFTPLRGFSAFRKEEKANELEMIFLTNIYPREMVIYKCAALWLQGLLIMLSAVPYGVLRYFTAGMNLAAAGYMFCFMLFIFVQAVAVSVSMSASRVTTGRAKLPFIAFWFLFFVGLFIPKTALYSGLSRYSTGSAGGHSGLELTAFLFFGVVGLASSIVLGASKITERGENHSFLKRALLFISSAGLVVFSYFKLDPEIMIWGGVYLLIPLLLSSIFEEGRPDLAGVSRSIGRQRWLGGLRRLFYRGWAGGTAAALISLVLFTSAVALSYPSHSTQRPVVWPELALAGVLFAVGLLGRGGLLYLLGSAVCVTAVLSAPMHLGLMRTFIAGVFLPLGLVRCFWPENRRTLVIYCLFQACLIFFGSVSLGAMGSRTPYTASAAGKRHVPDGEKTLVRYLPHLAFVKAFGGLDSTLPEDHEYNGAAAAEAALALLLLWLAARSQVAAARGTEELARLKLRQLPEGAKPWR